MARTRPAAVLLSAVVAASCASGSAHVSTARPPASLNALEASSEDVVDQVSRGRWARVDADLPTMRRDWARYQAVAQALDPQQARRIGPALAALGDRAAARDALGTQQAANDLSAPVVELLGHYAIRAPVQVGRLDVIGRQIVLDGAHGRFDAAARSVGAAGVQWRTIRAAVRRRNERVAVRVDRVLADLRATVDAKDEIHTKKHANGLLELVDGIERLY